MIQINIKLKEGSLDNYQQFTGIDINGLEIIGYIKWLRWIKMIEIEPDKPFVINGTEMPRLAKIEEDLSSKGIRRYKLRLI